MFVPDLDHFSYGELLPGLRGRAVGWLAGDEPYSRGGVPPGFVERLAELRPAKLEYHLMGYHECELCLAEVAAERRAEVEDYNQRRRANLERLRELRQSKKSGRPYDEEELRTVGALTVDFARDASDYEIRGETGHGEVHLADPVSGEIYVAPTMLLHYVRDHGYRPPEVFIPAVMASG